MAMHKEWINHTPAQEIAETSVRSSQLTSLSSGHSSSSIPATPDMGDIPLHQDLFCLPFRPADRIVCALTLLGPQSADAGLVLTPGSHRSSQMLTIDDDAMIIYEPLPRVSHEARKQLLLKSGDTLFYHPLLSHGLPASASSDSTLVSCHFASSECEYVIMSGHEGLVPPHLQQISRLAVHPEVIQTCSCIPVIIPSFFAFDPLLPTSPAARHDSCPPFHWDQLAISCHYEFGFIVYPAINFSHFLLPFHQNEWKGRGVLVRGKRITL